MSIFYRVYEVLSNHKFTGKEKINRIKKIFDSESEIRKDNETQKYYYKKNLLAVNFYLGRCDWTILKVAAKLGELDVVKWLVEEQGADIVKDASPLQQATQYGHVDVMDYLISKGIRVNLNFELQNAIQYGQFEAVQFLLNNGANPHVPAFRNLTAIAYAEDLIVKLDSLKSGQRVLDLFGYGEGPSMDYSLVPSISSIIKILNLLNGKPIAGDVLPTPIPEKQKLKAQLTKYISRIETYRDEKDPAKIDFAHGFWFFKDSRALNRQANYLLAKEMLAHLDCATAKENIGMVVTDAETQRHHLIKRHGLFSLPHFVNRGINSSELKAVIKENVAYAPVDLRK